MNKIDNHISWDDYFMGVARLSALRSKDPNTKVGACIVNSDKRIVGIGYNGFPFGCSDDAFPWEREGDLLDTKYPYVVHAEPNAILNSNSSLASCVLYVTEYPCNECIKLVIQAGIKEIVYISNKYKDTPHHQAALKMVKASKIKTRQLEVRDIVLN
ncbi:MAG: dCMP deaminase family protein [Acholeplasmatales bacterium]|jgi:dCMP deaminase|nr:dCMP deaminase family protein [Acholeplasmatales bacterium]